MQKAASLSTGGHDHESADSDGQSLFVGLRSAVGNADADGQGAGRGSAARVGQSSTGDVEDTVVGAVADRVPTATGVPEPSAPVLRAALDRAMSVGALEERVLEAPPIELAVTALALAMQASRIASTSETLLEVVTPARAVSAVESIATEP